MAYVLGVDIGTGSVKAVAVDSNNAVIAAHSLHYGAMIPKHGYHEQNPEEIWNAFTACLESIVKAIGYQPATVCLSSAMHSIIPVDLEGNAHAPMITWADNRSTKIAERLRSSAEGLAIYEVTGTPLHAMSPLCKLIWLKENEPQLFAKAQKFISIKEYIWHKLFHAFKIDHSIASATGLFNIQKLAWESSALHIAGVSEEKLSNCVPTDYKEIYRGSNVQLIEFAGIPFVIGASDGCLANLGCMAYEPGAVVITVGTSGAVRMLHHQPLPDKQAMTFNYILDAQNFVCGGPVNNGGLAIDWWLKLIRQPTDAAGFKALFTHASTVDPGCNGLIFLPYLTGERAPIWDSESSGSFFGIQLRHTEAHFSRAVLEGICYALKDAFDTVTTSNTIERVYISGGIVQSEEWIQLLSDIIGKSLHIVQTEDASAIGAAFLGRKAIGLADSYPASNQSIKVIHPAPANTAVYLKNFSIFKKLYTSSNRIMHELNALNN